MASANIVDDSDRSLIHAIENHNNVDSVPQVKVDEGLLDPRTIEMDLIREKRTVFEPLAENEVYNSLVRQTVLNWLFRVVTVNKMSIETSALAIRFFDLSMQYLNRSNAIQQNMLQCVCGAALLAANKLLETNVISLSTLIHYSGDSFTEQDVLQMELYITRCLIDETGELYGTTPLDMMVTITFNVCSESMFSDVKTKANILYTLLAPTPAFYGRLPSEVAGALIVRSCMAMTDMSVYEFGRIKHKILTLIHKTEETIDDLVDRMERYYIQWINDIGMDGQVLIPIYSKETHEGTPTDIFTTSRVMDMLRR